MLHNREVALIMLDRAIRMTKIIFLTSEMSHSSVISSNKVAGEHELTSLCVCLKETQRKYHASNGDFTFSNEASL